MGPGLRHIHATLPLFCGTMCVTVSGVCALLLLPELVTQCASSKKAGQLGSSAAHSIASLLSRIKKPILDFLENPSLFLSHSSAITITESSCLCIPFPPHWHEIRQNGDQGRHKFPNPAPTCIFKYALAHPIEYFSRYFRAVGQLGKEGL